jgi:ubiquinone/menaquinone biosynthesis C-methylase UbiE
MNIDKIRSDFDRIALCDTGGWSHNNHYHDFLVNQIPATCDYLLEIGCGTGSFSRSVAQHVDHVLALDLSPEMIRIAEECSSNFTNIDYLVADALNWDYPKSKFDCIVSIATFHHLPLEEILNRIKPALKPGGILMVLDLYTGEGIKDRLWSLMAIPAHIILKLIKTGRLREPPEVREAWTEHGKNERYLPLSKVRSVCVEQLPGMVLRVHLLWRYLILWKKMI